MTTTTLDHPPVRQRPRLVTGVLDIDAAGKGRLRAESCLPSPSDPSVSPALLRRHGLRKGDLVEGVRGDRGTLTEVTRVEGRTPDALRDRRHFRDLTPLHPHRRLRLEHPASGLAGLPGVHNPEFTDGRVTFDVDSDDLDAAMGYLTGVGLRSLTAHPPTLEELFLRHYGDDLSKAEDQDALEHA